MAPLVEGIMAQDKLFIDKSLNIIDEPTPTADYQNFIDVFNECFRRKHKVNPTLIDKLQTRLNTFTLDEVIEATRKMAQNRFYHGENERGWRASPDFLLRNDGQIDKFLNVEWDNKYSFVKPDRRASVEIRLLACLETGVWLDSVSAVYGQELIPYMEKNRVVPTLDNAVELLIKFVKEHNPPFTVNSISWSAVTSTYNRYLDSCRINQVKPLAKIITKAKEVLS
jgi:hypothetical protein